MKITFLYRVLVAALLGFVVGLLSVFVYVILASYTSSIGVGQLTSLVLAALLSFYIGRTLKSPSLTIFYAGMILVGEIAIDTIDLSSFDMPADPGLSALALFFLIPLVAGVTFLFGASIDFYKQNKD